MSIIIMSKRHFQAPSMGKRKPQSDAQAAVVLPRDTIQYMERVGNVLKGLLDGGAGDEGEVAEMVSSALDEVRGMEVNVACHSECSRTLEGCIRLASQPQVLELARAVQDKAKKLALNPSGSHVLEALLTRVISLVRETEETSTELRVEASVLLEYISGALRAQWMVLASNRYGSKVMRTFLSLLTAGASEEVPTLRRVAGAPVAARQVLSTVLDEPGETTFFDILSAILARFLERGKTVLVQYATHVYAAPVLSALLRVSRLLSLGQVSSQGQGQGQDKGRGKKGNAKAKATEDRDFTLSLIAMVLDCECEYEPGTTDLDLSGLDNDRVAMLMTGAESSMVLDTMCVVGPPSFLHAFYRAAMRQDLVEIAFDQYANYILQRFLGASPLEGEVIEVVQLLGPRFADLAQARGGVLYHIVLACEQYIGVQREVMRHLTAAFGEGEKGVVGGLLGLSGAEAETEAEAEAEADPVVLGALTISVLLRYTGSVAEAVFKGVSRLPPAKILALAVSVGGSRALEGFFRSGATPRLKHRVVRAVVGHWVELAMHPTASHVVETAYESCTRAATRELIVKELAPSAKELKRVPHGTKVLTRCHVQDYLERERSDWLADEEKRVAQRGVFDDILEDANEWLEGSASASASASGGVPQAGADLDLGLDPEPEAGYARASEREYHPPLDESMRFVFDAMADSRREERRVKRHKSGSGGDGESGSKQRREREREAAKAEDKREEKHRKRERKIERREKKKAKKAKVEAEGKGKGKDKKGKFSMH